MELSTVVAEGPDHEQVIVRRGERSGLPVIVAVHSTKLGPAVGGCRLWTYDDWRDGLADALRLSEAMSLKCSAAGLEHGGGKSVIAVPAGTTLDATTPGDGRAPQTSEQPAFRAPRREMGTTPLSVATRDARLRLAEGI